MKYQAYILSGVLFLRFFAPVVAFSNQGALGEFIEVDKKSSLIASSRDKLITDISGCTIVVSVSDSVTVRKYIAPSGRVFAIVWSGLIHPDLTLLLGSFNEEYQAAQRHSPIKPGSRRFHMETSNIVVQKWGHMRGLKGRVFAPALVPAGVTIEQIK